MSDPTEALARALPLTNCQCDHHYSEGQSHLCRQRRERERMWQAERILADPGPLLAALAIEPTHTTERTEP